MPGAGRNSRSFSRLTRPLYLLRVKGSDFSNSDHPNHFNRIRPVAGSTAFPQLIGGEAVEIFCDGVLERQGVMIVAGSISDYPGNHFRVGPGRRYFTEALTRVGGYLARQASRRNLADDDRNA